MFGDPHRGPTLLPQQRRAEVGVRGRRQPHLLADHGSEGAAGGQWRLFLPLWPFRPSREPVSATRHVAVLQKDGGSSELQEILWRRQQNIKSGSKD